MEIDAIQKFIMLEARSKQIQIIKFVELLQNEFMPSLPELVKNGVDESLEFLRGEFENDEDFQNYKEENIKRDLNLYPRSLWYSLFVQSFFFFEDDINELCKKLKSYKNYNLSLSEIRGRGIYRARKYLSKIVGLNFEETEEEWNDITNIQKIRNCISHSAGNISNSNGKKAILDYANNNRDITVDENEDLQFNYGFVVDSADTIREFWLGISLEIDNIES